MKKSFLLGGALLLMTGMSFAAPTPELLADLTNQILVQQTKTQSAKELFVQLKSLFTNCMTSHQDKALQASCTTFLEKHFPKIENQWMSDFSGSYTGEHINMLKIQALGTLTQADRLAYLGITAFPKKDLQIDIFGDLFEYSIVNLPEYQLSFFTLATKKEPIPHLNPLTCTQGIESLKKNIAFLEKHHPDEKNHIAALKESLKATNCVNNITINVQEKEDAGLKKHTFMISTPIDAKGNDFRILAEKKMIPTTSNFEETIKTYYDAPTKRTITRKFISTTLYSDAHGKLYYTDTLEHVNRRCREFITMGYTGDTSTFSKRTLGVGRNLQSKIEKGEAQVFATHGSLFIWLKEKPSQYYEIGLDIPELWFGGYVAVDLNTPDGNSSFLSK